MAVTLKFYADAGLTTELVSLDRSANADGSSGSVDAVVYLGSVAAGKTFRAASNPGVDALVLSVADAASGSGHPAGEIKLATSAGGLAAAVAGAPLNLGTQILSGAGNAIAVWVRWTNTVAVVGVSNELSLNLNTVLET